MMRLFKRARYIIFDVCVSALRSAVYLAVIATANCKADNPIALTRCAAEPNKRAVKIGIKALV
jgi:hypothetical protein